MNIDEPLYHPLQVAKGGLYSLNIKLEEQNLSFQREL
jgi:hypothetical protein